MRTELVTQDTQDFVQHFACSGNTPVDRILLDSLRANKCNVGGAQAEALPSVCYACSLLFLQAWAIPA